MSDTVARVRFLRRHQIYNRGEVAVYPLDQAERLIIMRVAEGLPAPAGIITKAEDAAPAAPAARQPAQVVRK